MLSSVEWTHSLMVQLLLGKDNVELNFPNGSSKTPLMNAVENRHEEVVELLLEKGHVDSNFLNE